MLFRSVHLGWETNSKAIIICLFINLKQSSSCYHYFWIHPLVVTITLNFCRLSLHNLTIFFVCMSDIVHSHAQHVEKKRRVLRGNTMSCRHRSMVGSMANPPHPSPDCNTISVLRRIQMPLTTPIYPPRCLLYLGMMMLVIPCICCLAVPTFDIIYVICLV